MQRLVSLFFSVIAVLNVKRAIITTHTYFDLKQANRAMTAILSGCRGSVGLDVSYWNQHEFL